MALGWRKHYLLLHKERRQPPLGCKGVRGNCDLACLGFPHPANAGLAATYTTLDPRGTLRSITYGCYKKAIPAPPPQMSSPGSLVDQGLQLHSSQAHWCERGHASAGSFWLLAACSRDGKAGLFPEGAGKTLLTGMGLEGFSCIPETSLA